MKYISILLIVAIVISSCSQPPQAPLDCGNSNGSSSQSVMNFPPLPNQQSSYPMTNSSQSKREQPDKHSASTTTLNSEVILSKQDIFSKCNPAVFMIYTSDGYNSYQGSGFFITSDGIAVSNYHVFEGTGIGKEVFKLTDGSTFKLEKVLLKDKENDVIVFKVASPSTRKFKCIPISSRTLRVGDTVHAIGSPYGLENTFSSGEISQLRESNLIQINAPIDHGSSGGVLLNQYGEAIGITSGGLEESGANLNFAININVIRNRF